jgi:phage terminase large subunit GpA-like protein
MLFDHAGFTGPPYVDAEALVASAIATALRPAPPLDLAAWTQTNIIFDANEPHPGPYRLDLFPFFARIFEVLGPEHPARTVTLRKSAQVGGTILGDAFILGYLDKAPGISMVVHPTLPQGKAWVNNKVKPHVRKSPDLQAMLSFDNPRDGKATELLFERLDARGTVIVTGANSAASLSQHTVKVQVQDDLSKWMINDKGDPETQANTRSRAYADAKIFKISTPTEEGNCRITTNFLAGTQEHYHVPCRQCGHLQPLEWAALQPNLDAAIAAEKPVASGAFFTCASGNGCIIEERDRAWMIDPANGAKWVAHNPAASEPSFYIWTAYAPLATWAMLAEEYLAARGDQAKLWVFLNDSVGLAYKTAGEAPDYEALKTRGDASEFRRGVIASGYYFLFAGTDVQADRVEVGIWAVGPNLRRQPVDHIVIPGKIADAETRKALDDVLARKYPDAWGKPVGIEHLAIDVGFERQNTLDWVKTHPPSRVSPIVGSRSDNAPALGLHQTREATIGGKRVKAERIVYEVGGGSLKAFLYGDLRKADPLARGFVALGRNWPVEWYEQLTSEVRVEVEDKRHRKVWRWDRLKGRRNEVLDCAVYAHWAAEMKGWKRLTDDRWSAIAAERDGPRETAQGDLLATDLPATAPRAPTKHSAPAPVPSHRDDVADDYWKGM